MSGNDGSVANVTEASYPVYGTGKRIVTMGQRTFDWSAGRENS